MQNSNKISKPTLKKQQRKEEVGVDVTEHVGTPRTTNKMHTYLVTGINQIHLRAEESWEKHTIL